MRTGRIDGATGICDIGGLWTDKEEFIKLSEAEIGISQRVDVCAKDPVSVGFEIVSETGGVESNFYLGESGVETWITSSSEKKKLVTGVIGSKVDTVSSRVFEAERSIWDTSDWFQFKV